MPKDVLVVEDDAISQFVIVEMCRELGFECMTAADGQEAIDVVNANPNKIGVVLMDLHMPLLSGFDATKMIRNCTIDPPKNLPVVATTADLQWHSESRCIEFGFDSVLPKPLEFSMLASILNQFSA